MDEWERWRDGWVAGWIERGGPWLEGLLLKEMVAAAQQVAVDGA